MQLFEQITGQKGRLAVSVATRSQAVKLYDKPGTAKMYTASLQVQACDDTKCLAPETMSFQVPALNGSA